ncbi:hypothetical protein ACI2IP_07235 [Microbacterium sp. NPDC090218]
MSGLDIDHGGAIAVDTERLRDVGSRMMVVAGWYREAHAAIGRACASIASEPRACPHLDAGALQRSAERLDELRSELDDACVGTLLMADAFEVVELRAEAEALARTDAAAADAVLLRIDRLVNGDERIGVMADWLVAGWEDRRFDGTGRQFDAGGLLLPLFLAGAFVGVSTGLGKVAAGVPLQGRRADPVHVTAVKTSTPAAPQSLAGAFRRMPSSSAQVAVEKYTMPDGTTRYVTYISGTKNSVPWRGGEEEPWDMKSNVELYQGHVSASYQATLDALAAAGAEPGDRVDTVAYSQGGMIAAHLAMESEYDVTMQLTAGSPQEPTLEDDQTLIQLRHSDDLVSNLAAGGSAAGTGSADSFTATRVGDPQVGLQDVRLQAHALETYIETAQLVDASTDPRAEALDAYWAELGTAAKVERTEFHAERTG